MDTISTENCKLADDAANKLRDAVATAKVMYESNLECLANIKMLKRAKDEAEAIQTQLARDANEEKAKYEATIAEQRKEIDRLRPMSALTGAWCGLLSASGDIELPQVSPSSEKNHNPVLLCSPRQQAHPGEAIPESAAAAAALCLLSTYIAKEVVLLSSSPSATPHLPALAAAHLPSDSFLGRVLERVWVLQGEVDGRLLAVEREKAELLERAIKAEARYADLLQHMQKQQQQQQQPSPAARSFVTFSPQEINNDKVGSSSSSSSSSSREGTPIEDYKSFMRTLGKTPQDRTPSSSAAAAASRDAQQQGPVVVPHGPSTPLRLFPDDGQTCSPSPEGADAIAGKVAASASPLTVPSPSLLQSRANRTSPQQPSRSRGRSVSPGPGPSHALPQRSSRYAHVTSPVRAYIIGCQEPSAESKADSRHASPAVHLHTPGITFTASVRATSPSLSRGNDSAQGNTKNATSRSRSPCEMSQFSLPSFAASPAGLTLTLTPKPTSTPVQVRARAAPLSVTKSADVINAVLLANHSVGAMVRRSHDSPRTPTAPGRSHPSTSTSPSPAANVRTAVQYSPSSGKMESTLTQAAPMDTTMRSSPSTSTASVLRSAEKISASARVRMVMHHGEACSSNSVLKTTVYAAKEKERQRQLHLEMGAGKPASVVAAVRTPPSLKSAIATVTPPDHGEDNSSSSDPSLVVSSTRLHEENSVAVSTVVGCNTSVGYISEDSTDALGCDPALVWPTTPSSKKTNPLAPNHKPASEDSGPPVWPTTPSSKKTNPLGPVPTAATASVGMQPQHYRPLISPEAIKFYKKMEEPRFADLARQHPAVLREAVLAMNVIDGFI